MKFYCVVCNSKYKYYKECCTPKSLIRYEKKGFPFKKEYYYTLEGNPLTISEVLSICDKELSEYKILQSKREEEKILQDFTLKIKKVSSLVNIFPRTNNTSYLQGVCTAQELQAMNVMEMLNIYAAHTSTQTFLCELYSLWQISVSMKHVSSYSKAWEYLDAAKVFIKKTQDAITPALVTNLKTTNDIKTIVDTLSKQKGWLSDNERNYLERVVESVRIYLNSVLPNISSELLNLIDGLRENKFRVTGIDADEIPFDSDFDLFHPITFLTSKQIKLRKDQSDEND